MISTSALNCMKQQGFPEEAASTCGEHFAGLSFQPRVVATVVVLGIVLQSPVVFLALSAALWWSALVPMLNPFEAFYNRALAGRLGRCPLRPAPGPRRFAQGMAGTMMLLVGLSLLRGWTTAAWVLEAFAVVAVSALLFGNLCFGSYIYQLLRGKVAFANATMPWSRAR